MPTIYYNDETESRGRVNLAKVDATTDEEIEAQIREDEAEAKREAAIFHAAKVRQLRDHYKLSQKDFAKRLNVPLQTIINWEQGKRAPTGAARSLLKILSRHPAAISWLES